MKLQMYQVLHVTSVMLLAAFLFQAFANPDPKNRKRTAIITGILALMTLVGGFGLQATMKLGFPVWIFIKLMCWLGLASLSGLAYRKPERIPLLTGVAIALILIAVATVYIRHLAEGVYE